MTPEDLRRAIEELAALPAEGLGDRARPIVQALLAALESGEVRAAEPVGDGWRVNAWVKQGILLAFRAGRVVNLEPAGPLTFSDKDTMPAQRIDGAARGVRIVPGGSSVRSGACIGKHVTIMPPAYVNVGAFIGDGTLVDSHALVGSCAQVGRRVHVSAAAQVGGVLEPIGALPVIVEDEVLLGGNTGVYEGTIVKRRAVIGAGVVLTGSTPVHDLVRETVYRRSPEGPLTIPEGAVVVPGSRPAAGRFAEARGLHLAVPVIVKYRDDRTDAATALEDALR